MNNSFEHKFETKNAKSFSSEALRQDAITKVLNAFTQDTSLQEVLDIVEKTILAEAMDRHKSMVLAYKSLRIPKTTFFHRKNRYFR